MAASASNSLRKSKKDDVEALLSDLDNLDPANSNNSSVGGATHSATKADDAQSLLDDLDDLVKRRAPTPKKPSLLSPSSNTPARSTPVGRGETPTPIPTNTLTVEGGSTSTIAAGSSAPLEEANLSASVTDAVQSASTTSQPSWGTWWSSATKLADQARAELEKRAAMVQSQVVDNTKEGGESNGGSNGLNPSGVPWAIAQNVNSFLKNNRDLNKLKNDLGKVGIKGWNELLNVVVPPIEQHEILSITLSHDMIGYEGISDVVFSVLQRVMERHASSHSSEHQLVVNKAPERSSISDDKPVEENQQGERNMMPVTGFEQGWKLAESKLSKLIDTDSEEKAKAVNTNNTSASTVALPITTCPLFIRIQPVLDVMPGSSTSSKPSHLFLQVLLQDPKNSLTHRTISQSIPKAFADLDLEEHAWVEELLSESLQGALGSIALEYIQGRNLGTSLRDDVVEAAAEAQKENSSDPL